MIVEVSKERTAELIEKTAKFFAERRMGAPAILFIESFRPLHFLGSQAMYFLSPFVTTLFDSKEFEEMAAILDSEENVKYLINRIDELDMQFNAAEREKERIKRQKFWKKWKSMWKKKKSGA
ncbi:MAG: hypothetical protein FWG20_01990 [Candidatus Cloacimonetes bacterium]|nr:hypothetical protein [Candidatus Cloacimonadota bacterium]